MPKTTQSVYQFICQFMAEHNGLSPSQREIADGCFISQSTVGRHLDILMAQGCIRRVSGVFRSISLTDKGKKENPIK